MCYIEVLLLCYDICARSFLLRAPFSSVFYLASAGVDLSLIPPSCKSRMHVAILRRENQPVVIVQLNLVRRVIFRSPRRVSIPQRDYCSCHPSVFAYPDATFHSRVYAGIATLRLPEGLRLPRALVRDSGQGATPSLLGLLSSLRCTLPEAFVRLGFLSSLVPLQTGGRRRICNVSLGDKQQRTRKDRSARELGKKKKVRETRQTNNSSFVVLKQTQNVPNVPFKQ